MPMLGPRFAWFHDAVAHALAKAPLADASADIALVLLFDAEPWWRFHDAALPLLSSTEVERAHRFRQARHRDTYVLAHALWRSALGAVLGAPPASVPLASSAGGQPLLPGTTYATSLSHSENMVAIAIARAPCIGVDIEQAPPRANLHDLATVLCAPAEAQAMAALPPAQHNLALLALWTRKEALLKAFGVGLREAPASIAADAGMLIAPPPGAPFATPCRVHPLPLTKTLVGAVAAPDDITSIAVHWLQSPSPVGDVSAKVTGSPPSRG